MPAATLSLSCIHTAARSGRTPSKGLGLDERKRRLGTQTGGVVQLIYMCAFAMPEGGSMIDKVREFDREHLMPIVIDCAEDDSCVPRDPKTILLGPDHEDDESRDYLSTLVRWNGKCMYQDIARCAWREIPVTYIYTSRDMTVPLDDQKSMVAKMKAEGRDVQTIELDTGHCPNLTATQAVVDVIVLDAASWTYQAES